MNTTIKEIPLLFQTEMVQTILAGRKTQTRRMLNQQPDEECYYEMNFQDGVLTIDYNAGDENPVIRCPYGKPGDLLWVRETWLRLDKNHIITIPIAYKANSDPDTEEIRKDYIKAGYPYKWKPSIHMPKAACRIWLMVEEIRVERVQDISARDAVAEGVEVVKVKGSDGTFYKHYNVTGELKKIADANNADPLTIDPVSSFQSLWESINGWDSWKINPWVWVVKFRVLSKTGRPSEEAIQAAYKSITSK